MMNPTTKLVSEIHYHVRRMSTISLYIITPSYVTGSWHQVLIAFLIYSIALDKSIFYFVGRVICKFGAC